MSTLEPVPETSDVEVSKTKRAQIPHSRRRRGQNRSADSSGSEESYEEPNASESRRHQDDRLVMPVKIEFVKTRAPGGEAGQGSSGRSTSTAQRLQEWRPADEKESDETLREDSRSYSASSLRSPTMARDMLFAHEDFDGPGGRGYFDVEVKSDNR